MGMSLCSLLGFTIFDVRPVFSMNACCLFSVFLGLNIPLVRSVTDVMASL